MSNQNDKATPRPWELSTENQTRILPTKILNEEIGDDFCIATTADDHYSPDEPDEESAKANAELIVMAVNSHDALVDALQKWQAFWHAMPKGQLGNIVFDIGLLNDAFLATSKALKQLQVKHSNKPKQSNRHKSKGEKK